MARLAPDFNVESSGPTVDVRIIDTTTWISGFAISKFIANPIKGHEKLDAPAFSFLVEHPTSGRKLVFDLGVRKDQQNMPPVWVKGLASFGDSVKLVVKKGVREILEEHGVSGADVEAVVWSHWHFDHVGDPSTFDPHTALIVGPGFKEAFLPGYPANENGVILESDYAGRELREIEFTQGKKVGRFNAFDYFGDGSFYLLDSPGHAIGHLCGLAKVTSSPDSFIFMGGDAAHHGGEFRPSEYLPLPDSIYPHPLHSTSPIPCPGALFEHLLPNRDRKKAFLAPSRLAREEGGAHHDPDEAARTIEKMQEADAHNRILVVVAHDKSLMDVVEFFPAHANDFVAKGWVEKGRWAFLRDFEKALE